MIGLIGHIETCQKEIHTGKGGGIVERKCERRGKMQILELAPRKCFMTTCCRSLENTPSLENLPLKEAKERTDNNHDYIGEQRAKLSDDGTIRKDSNNNSDNNSCWNMTFNLCIM